MKYTASDVAKHLIASFSGKNAISNLKLQKLLYYSQAWHLVFYDKALFDDKIEAWVHGPVVRSVFGEYKIHRWNPIPNPGKKPDFPKEIQEHLSEVIRVYGKFDAVSLERLTHQEDPWRDARKGLAPDEPSTRVITHEAMKKFHCLRLNNG